MASVPRIRFAAPFRATSGSARWRLGRRPGFGPAPAPAPPPRRVRPRVGPPGARLPRCGLALARDAPTPRRDPGPLLGTPLRSRLRDLRRVLERRFGRPRRRPHAHRPPDRVQPRRRDRRLRDRREGARRVVDLARRRPREETFRWPPSLGRRGPAPARAAPGARRRRGVARAAPSCAADPVPPRDAAARSATALRRRRRRPPAPPSALWPRARSPGSSSPPRAAAGTASLCESVPARAVAPSPLSPAGTAAPATARRRASATRGGGDRRGEDRHRRFARPAGTPRREAREPPRPARGRDVDEGWAPRGSRAPCAAAAFAAPADGVVDFRRRRRRRRRRGRARRSPPPPPPARARSSSPSGCFRGRS